MNIPEIKEILRQASVVFEIQGHGKHIALFESDFERVAIELVKKLTLTDVGQQRELLKAYTKWLNDKLRDEEELNELIDNYFDSL